MHNWLHVFTFRILSLEMRLLPILRVRVISYLPAGFIGLSLGGLLRLFACRMLNRVHFWLAAGTQF